MAPHTAAVLADLVLAAHLAVVLFVVLGELLFLLGGWRGWQWVRLRWMRGVHVLLMAFIALQAWLGQLCPLTGWEQALRTRAGEATYSGSFIGHWLGELLYIDAPWWVFVAAYSAFAVLVLATWRIVPPRPGSGRGVAASTKAGGTPPRTRRSGTPSGEA